MKRPDTMFRWLFENRRTGRITISQFPNWPLWGIAACWVVGRFADGGSTLADVAGGMSTVLWLFWGSDELVRGVNPWRRLLGAGVITWQLVAVL